MSVNWNEEVYDENEKKLRALVKKREQIDALVKRQSQGERLEKNQVFVFVKESFISFDLWA